MKAREAIELLNQRNQELDENYLSLGHEIVEFEYSTLNLRIIDELPEELVEDYLKDINEVMNGLKEVVNLLNSVNSDISKRVEKSMQAT